MARSADASLMSELWRQNFGNPGGTYNPTQLRQKWEGADEAAMQDYERLMGAGAASPAPVTIRQASRPALPPPGAPSSGFSMPSASGTGAGGTTTTSLPTYDTGAVEKLAQRFAAPGIRKLRNTVQEVQQGVYENPNVKRMTVRDALSGFGQGLESVMGGALKEGAGVYGQQYGAAVNEALLSKKLASAEKMQADEIAARERMNQYNKSWEAYLKSAY